MAALGLSLPWQGELSGGNALRMETLQLVNRVGPLDWIYEMNEKLLPHQSNVRQSTHKTN